MKRAFWAALCLACLAALPACGERAEPDTVLVFLEEAQGCAMEDNGRRVAVGEDVVFTLRLDLGWSLTDTDYAGAFDISASERAATLTLRDVRYPARVRLRLASRYCTVTYEANGGQSVRGGALRESRTYDLTGHARPNTALGSDLFSREGYTLTGWNTSSDGSGEAVGLGSRVSAPDSAVTLYAQWARWSGAGDFTWRQTPDGTAITGYGGSDGVVVIPEVLDGRPVTSVEAGAFQGCGAAAVVLPPTMLDVAPGAFQNCALRTLTLFDSIRSVGDGSFQNCPELTTLRINAAEPPFGYVWRKESCYADKIDRLILTQGQKRAVFYGGCSMWYNLDGVQAQQALGEGYAVVNLGLNGTVNSLVQMQIMGAFLGEGDLVIHTPELSSRQQMLLRTAMGEEDDKLWCGIENNYDLFALVDLTTVVGVLDSLCGYLSQKNARATYAQVYQDESGQPYMDRLGCIPFFRSGTQDDLPDRVGLDPAYVDGAAMERLGEYYAWFQSRGARVYVSCACVNLDAVPEGQRENAPLMDSLLREAVGRMEGVALISSLEDYLYENGDFFDTNYHLVTQAARENTALWLRDLRAQMERDGVWEGV